METEPLLLAICLLVLIPFNKKILGANGTSSTRYIGSSIPTRGTSDCYKFTRLFNMLTPDGDLTIRAGDKISPEACQRACLSNFKSRVCIAANQRHGGYCLLAGYKLYPNRRATHFRRLCRKGRPCFKAMSGMESRFHTGTINLPPLVSSSEWLAADLCRRECEELVYCTGFDVIENQSYCPYTEFRPVRNLYFNMYLRSC